MSTAKKAVPKRVAKPVSKKAATSSTSMRDKVVIAWKNRYDALQNETEALTKKSAEMMGENEVLRERINLLESLFNKTGEPVTNGYFHVVDDSEWQERNQVQKTPCPKCQILSILETLTEGQINAVLRDVQLEVEYSRKRNRNTLEIDEVLAKSKLTKFLDNVVSFEPYN